MLAIISCYFYLLYKILIETKTFIIIHNTKNKLKEIDINNIIEKWVINLKTLI